MNIIVIDGQGGQIGAQLIKEINAQSPGMDLFPRTQHVESVVLLCRE